MQFAPGQLIAMDQIEIGPRVRAIDENYAQSLAANFEEHGIKTPVIVRPFEGRLRLVIGGHRHRAAQILDWPEIPGFVIEMTDEEAALAEIDENLIRFELTTLDRAISLEQRKAAYERLHPETRHGGDRKKGKSQNFATCSKRFTADVAERINLSERSVQAAIQLATNLDHEAVSTIRGTWIADNQSALQKLAAEPPIKQRNLARMIRDNSAPSLDVARIRAGYTDAPPPEEVDPQGTVLARLMDLWVKAEPRTRERFLAEVKLAEEAAAAKPKGSKVR